MKKTWIIIVIAAVVVLALGGYWWWQKRAIAPQQSQISVPADWKTYTNEKMGFSLKYPPTWHICTPAEFTSGLGDNILKITSGSSGTCPGGEHPADFLFIEGPFKLLFPDYPSLRKAVIESQADPSKIPYQIAEEINPNSEKYNADSPYTYLFGPKSDIQKEIDFNGIPALTNTTSDPETFYKTFYRSPSITFYNNRGLVLELSFTFDSDSEQDHVLLKQIISTFQLTK